MMTDRGVLADAKLVRMLAPKDVTGTSLGTEHGMYEIVDRIAMVPPGAVEALVSAGWKQVPTPVSDGELEELKAQRDALLEAAVRIDAQLADQRAQRAALQGRGALVDQALLDDAVSPEQVAELHQRIEAIGFTIKTLESARRVADERVLELLRKISDQERLRDTPLQEAKAAPMRVEAEACVVQAVACMTGAVKAMRRRLEIEREVAGLPYAEPLARPKMLDMVNAVRKGWPEPRALDLHESWVVRWILTCLAGPGNYVPSEVQRSLNIEGL